MIYILTGGPATGKGTRSEILANALKIPHIATGDMLREVALHDEEIREKLANGILISDEIITKLLEDRIKKDDCKEGFVLDGYPRTFKQAELLDELLNKLGRSITKVIELTVPDELAFKRILERKIRNDSGKNTCRIPKYLIKWMEPLSDNCMQIMGKKWILSIRRCDRISRPTTGYFRSKIL